MLYDYQGKAGSNFRGYFPVQASESFYGGLAPCQNTTTRPEIAGLTCTTGFPLGAPTGLRIVR